MENSSQAAKKPPNGGRSVKTRGKSHKKKVITRAEIVAWKREKRVEKKVETNGTNNIVTDDQLEASLEKRNMPISNAIGGDPKRRKATEETVSTALTVAAPISVGASASSASDLPSSEASAEVGLLLLTGSLGLQPRTREL
jgi:hypothetical protein